MRTILVFAAACLAAELALTRPVGAQAPDWAVDGAGCVPTETSIQNGAYLVTAGRIKFHERRVGDITLICPVAVGVGPVMAIGVSYRDASGAADNAHVSAVLRRLDKRTGAVSDVKGLAFQSDGDNGVEYRFGLVSLCNSSYTLDDDKYYLFVQVQISRKDHAIVVEFGGVELNDIDC